MCFTLTAQAQAKASPLSYQYETQWLEALSEKDGEARAKLLETLLTKIDLDLKKHSSDVGLLIVRGNINMEIAAALNNMSSLSYLKDGKKDLEKAIDQQPGAMDSMAEASLAAAIYWAPGWPLAYGDEDEALELFEQSLKADPDSAEVLTQYAHILNTRGNSQKALDLFKQAMARINSNDTAEQTLLMQVRKEEIQTAIQTTTQNMAQK